MNIQVRVKNANFKFRILAKISSKFVDLKTSFKFANFKLMTVSMTQHASVVFLQQVQKIFT